MGFWKKLVNVARNFNEIYDRDREIERKKEENIRILNKHPEYGATCRQCKHFVGGADPACAWGYHNYTEPKIVPIREPDRTYCDSFEYQR